MTSRSRIVEPAAMITFTAEEMKARGFPVAALSLSTEGTALHGITVPGGVYVVVLSGPPGGPSIFSISVSKRAPLAEVVWSLFGAERFRLRILGGEDIRLRVAGEMRSVIAWTMQPTPWIDSRGAVIVPLRESDSVLFVQFSAVWKDGEGLVPDIGQAKVLASLRVCV